MRSVIALSPAVVRCAENSCEYSRTREPRVIQVGASEIAVEWFAAATYQRVVRDALSGGQVSRPIRVTAWDPKGSGLGDAIARSSALLQGRHVPDRRVHTRSGAGRGVVAGRIASARQPRRRVYFGGKARPGTSLADHLALIVNLDVGCPRILTSLWLSGASLCSSMLTSLVGVVAVAQGVGQAVAVGAGFEDVAAEGKAIDDGRAEYYGWLSFDRLKAMASNESSKPFIAQAIGRTAPGLTTKDADLDALIDPTFVNE